jgi:hypothetical protein
MEKTCCLDITVTEHRNTGSQKVGPFFLAETMTPVIFEAWLLIARKLSDGGGGGILWLYGRITVYASPHVVFSRLNVSHM